MSFHSSTETERKICETTLINLTEAEKEEKSLEFSESSPDYGVKDSGYAWVVLGAMFFTNMLTVGYVKSFGIIYNSLSDIHPEISTTMAGLMMGLLSGSRSILAPLAGALGNLVGMRTTMFIGASISFISLISSYFCTSAIQYTIVLGAFTGLSHCLVESCQVVVMAHYFEKRQALANGIRVAGNPFGGVIYPLLLTLLLEVYGLRLTFILLAAVMAHIFISTALTRPFAKHTKIQSIKYVEKLFAKREIIEEQSLIKNNSINGMKSDMLKVVQANLTSSSNTSKKTTLDTSFFRNPVYLLFTCMAIAIPMACPLVYYYATIYSKTILELTIYEVSTLLAVQSIFDVVMRLFIGVLNNKKWYKMAHGYIFWIFNRHLIWILWRFRCHGIGNVVSWFCHSSRTISHQSNKIGHCDYMIIVHYVSQNVLLAV